MGSLQVGGGGGGGGSSVKILVVAVAPEKPNRKTRGTSRYVISRRLGPTLPPSLKYLELTNDLSRECKWKWSEEDLKEVLRDWIEGDPGWRKFTPNLKKVYVCWAEWRKWKKEDWEGYWGGIERLMEKGGVGWGRSGWYTEGNLPTVLLF